jgi:hypothetical protein
MYNSFTLRLLAQDRITRYLKEAADQRRVAAAVARRAPVRARGLRAAVTKIGLVGLAVRALTPRREERGESM